jgi:hypothetical protein
MFYFISYNATKLGVDRLLSLPVTYPTKIEVGAVANVKLVILRPADESMIAVCLFHGRGFNFARVSLLRLPAVPGSDARIALIAAHGYDSVQFRMFELPV